MIVGYARVSTLEQSLQVQENALRAVGADKIFAEKLSGATNNRPQLRAAVEFCREGDIFLVTRLDRFARSSVDLHNIVAALVAKGVGFKNLALVAQSLVADTVNAKFSLMPDTRLKAGIIVSWPDPSVRLQKGIEAYEKLCREAKIGRNEPCPCGSGRKAKHCHQRA